jgi:hypothetical protein
MRLVPLRKLVKRDVSYEFMNRQMVWHAFTVGRTKLHDLTGDLLHLLLGISLVLPPTC